MFHPALGQIEGEEQSGQQPGHVGPGIALVHIQGGDEVVPQQHHRDQARHAAGQAQDRALLGMDLLVDEAGGARRRRRWPGHS